jgi:hypothetical protein
MWLETLVLVLLLSKAILPVLRFLLCWLNPVNWWDFLRNLEWETLGAVRTEVEKGNDVIEPELVKLCVNEQEWLKGI